MYRTAWYSIRYLSSECRDDRDDDDDDRDDGHLWVKGMEVWMTEMTR
jgi:hypothetical protein